MDLRKAYDTVKRERLFITLKGYVAGPWLYGILETFWECQQVMLRYNGFPRPALPATMCTTQGGIFTPTLFNVVVDNIIRTWLAMTVEDQRVSHDTLGETIGRLLGLFYSYDCIAGSRDSD